MRVAAAARRRPSPVQEGPWALGRAARSACSGRSRVFSSSSSTWGRDAGKVALACSARLAHYARPEAPLVSCNLALGGRRQPDGQPGHNRRKGKRASSEEPIHSATSGRGGSAKRVGGRIHQERRAPLHEKKGARRCRRAPRPPRWWCLSSCSVLNHRPRAPWRPRERRSRPRAGCVRARRRPCRCRAAW